MAEGKALTQKQIQGKIDVIDAKVEKYRGYIANLGAEKKKLATLKKKLAAAAVKPKKASAKAGKVPAKPKAKPAAKESAAKKKEPAGKRVPKAKKTDKADSGGSVLEGILAEVKKSGIGVDDIIASLTGK